MTDTALITGATAGIGAEFARQLARRGWNLVLVARNAERLEHIADDLQQRFQINVEVITADLTQQEQLKTVENRLRDRARPIELLVNNAGFGLKKPFEQNDLEEEQSHLDILLRVPMRLTHAVLPGMLERGKGRIISVASVAGFIPSGTYGASKAWVISFSRWANIFYRARGVKITALCPGFVRTEFHDRMRVSTEQIPEWMWLSPEQVVWEGLRDNYRGRAVSVPSARYKIAVALTRVLPARVAVQRTRKDS
ncbi:SDR family oxidoreductase [Lysinibacter sp. HNR]|uniref:SDR family NAD(P)-dependent oxidoreductase n=1 Tax=Lysinibacter sp. HNR TaxID=3031408 RepID=UPI0024357501|nr:SDR family oxidoreductase [Lysinibacter sp. HNR]WGD38264.1 SDR family oxidoreductase [Lysinibacter sp. HNR]